MARVFLVCLALALRPGSCDDTQMTAQPEGSHVTFACDSASWIKEDVNKVDSVISLGETVSPEAPGGDAKYQLTDKGRRLTVTDLTTADSGLFKCKNFKY